MTTMTPGELGETAARYEGRTRCAGRCERMMLPEELDEHGLCDHCSDRRLETSYDGDRIEVAWNPLTRRWERVYPESELGDQEPTVMYWCRSAGRYVTIPKD